MLPLSKHTHQHLCARAREIVRGRDQQIVRQVGGRRESWKNRITAGSVIRRWTLQPCGRVFRTFEARIRIFEGFTVSFVDLGKFVWCLGFPLGLIGWLWKSDGLPNRFGGRLVRRTSEAPFGPVYGLPGHCWTHTHGKLPPAGIKINREGDRHCAGWKERFSRAKRPENCLKKPVM